MQQRTRRLAMVIGGTLLSTIGFLAACSTDNGTSPLPGQTNGTDSGRSKGDGGSSTDDDEDEDSGSSSGKDAASTADCSTAPKLRNNEPGFFCSFFTRDAAAGDAGGKSNCANDEICCNPGPKTPGGKDFPPSFCADKSGGGGNAACAAQAGDNASEWVEERSSTWECGDKNACGGQKCCMFTWANAAAGDKVNVGASIDKDVPKACGALMAFKTGGTRCAATCDAEEIELCSLSDDNCSGSQKCTPFSANFRDLAYCK